LADTNAANPSEKLFIRVISGFVIGISFPVFVMIKYFLSDFAMA